MKHVQLQTAKIKAIPRVKHRKKAWQTVGGVGVAIFALFIPRIAPEFPVAFAMVVFGFGAFISSKDLLVQYAGFAPAAVRDMYAAIAGKKPDA